MDENFIDDHESARGSTAMLFGISFLTLLTELVRNLSMAAGFNSLYILAGAAYLGALLLSRRAERNFA